MLAKVAYPLKMRRMGSG